MTVETRKEYETVEKEKEVHVCDHCNNEINEEIPISVPIHPIVTRDKNIRLNHFEELLGENPKDVELEYGLSKIGAKLISLGEKHYHRKCAVDKFDIDNKLAQKATNCGTTLKTVAPQIKKQNKNNNNEKSKSETMSFHFIAMLIISISLNIYFLLGIL